MCTSTIDGPPSEEMREYGCAIQSDACLGLDSCWLCHSPNELRRRVFNKQGNLAYMPVPCSATLTQTGEQKQIASGQTQCIQGNKCRSAHTKNEIMFHPLTFKTLTCPNSLGDSNSCEQSNCPYFHCEDEKRNIGQFAVPLKS